jgi:hypothetical protein
MNSTLQRLIQSLGFKQDIDNVKSNNTEGVDSISEVYNLLLSNINRITSLENSLTGNTINTGTTTSTTNAKLAFSPMNISSCDLAPTAGTTQYYYLTIAEMDMTISKAKLWGYSGTDTVLFGIYRGTFASHTLIGEGSAVCNVGPNIINITPKQGQTLDVVAGENLIVGFYPNGTSWRTIYDTGINDLTFGLTNTNNINSMPSNIIGTATAVRFALTLY